MRPTFWLKKLKGDPKGYKGKTIEHLWKTMEYYRTTMENYRNKTMGNYGKLWKTMENHGIYLANPLAVDYKLVIIPINYRYHSIQLPNQP